MTDRRIISEFVIEPGTGKAIELLKGQILRIEQVEGGQCADFNCFNLHDYKEFMHCGRTRTVHGFHPTTGTFMWSAPPRERAMLYILEDTVGRNDVLFPRCSAYVYEAAYGFAVHTNCHDIQAEAQREYGLTPDDVHDSFNLFMCTGVDDDGHAFMTRQTTKPGDYVDLLALMDVLAVPNVCGADVMKTSNFALKPLKLTVFAADDADLAQVPKTPTLASQRTPKDFKNPTIKTDRPLRRDPAYTPEFPNTPIVVTDLAISLSAEELAMFNAVKRSDIYGEDDAAALRDLLFSWWEERFLQAHAWRAVDREPMMDAIPTPDAVTFDFRTLSARDRYKLMIGTVVPRPIALVTTVDPDGKINAAPFSFFNCLSADPPILALGVENFPDMSFKHTAHNIRLTEVFTVNIVSRAIAEAMHVCAVPFANGRDELQAAGLTAMPGTVVASPWIKEAPASFECRRHVTLELGKSRQIILGEIVFAHYQPDIIDTERMRIDPAKLDAIARLGGDTCATIRDRFEMPTPTLADFEA